ncbi:zinc finger protein bud20 [Chytriomyces cf. hyalinus JEL632]|nr:zinc finger protein bud20 [Chytriomyces cf. hyalinus JEL632]
MTRIARKKMHKSIRDVKRSSRTRARVKDLDQIHEDIAKTLATTSSTELQPNAMASTELDPDLPGLGQFYCIHCAKYFISQPAMDVHLASKPHKKRVKVLKEVPYTQEEAEAAVGLRSAKSSKPAKMNVDEPSTLFADLNK